MTGTPPRPPHQRWSLVLRLLRQAPGQILSSRQIWDAVVEYQGGAPSGRKMWRRDLQHLVERGLIEAGLSTPDQPNRTGVQLRFVGKPEDVILSEAEHAALRRARTRHAAGPTEVTRGRSAGGGEGFDLLLAALRVLEEGGETRRVDDLATELRADPVLLRDLLRDSYSVVVEPDQDPAFQDLELEWDEARDGLDELDPADVSVLVTRNASQRFPLRGRGLDALGSFAYTAAETGERLALIEVALAAEPEASDADELRSAQRKLRQWAALLPGATGKVVS